MNGRHVFICPEWESNKHDCERYFVLLLFVLTSTLTIYNVLPEEGLVI